ncbi:MAG: DUF2510 domain-containing protein [Actinomycetota bacterium]
MSALPPPGGGRAHLRQRGRRLLLWGLVLLVVGIIASFIATEIDQEYQYRVAVGPLIAGVALFVVGLVQLAKSGRSTGAGWYPDPTGRHDRRWWDGAKWTADITDRDVQGADPTWETTAAPPPASGWIPPGDQPS